MQWQDAQNKWHNVTGWQGSLDEDGTETWWVGCEDFGSGPFRWVVWQGKSIVVVSDSFNLPTTANESLMITLSLD